MTATPSPAVLDDHVALVSGGSRGLGRGISLALARHGAAVVVNYGHSAGPAQETVDRIQEAGGRAIAAQADVTDAGSVQSLAQAASDAFGPVSILVNNATGPQPTAAIADSDWQHYVDQLDFMVKAPLLLGQAVLPDLRRRGGGRIINVGSEVVARPEPGMGAYVTAKAALTGMTRAWARELGPDAITVNLVAPGFVPVERHADVETAERDRYRAQVPLGRLGVPQDVAEAVVFFASPAASFITGQAITVNGGRTFTL